MQCSLIRYYLAIANQIYYFVQICKYGHLWIQKEKKKNKADGGHNCA